MEPLYPSDECGLPMGVDEFENLYGEMLPVVFRYATTRLGKSDGEEVTSDVFHAAAKLFQSGRAQEVTPAWLIAVTKNKVIDRWRREERRSKVTHLVKPRIQDLRTDSAEAIASEKWSDVMTTLDKLPTKHRALLIMRYVDDHSLAELAEQAGMSESAAESALARARRAFRGVFEEVS